MALHFLLDFSLDVGPVKKRIILSTAASSWAREEEVRTFGGVLLVLLDLSLFGGGRSTEA